MTAHPTVAEQFSTEYQRLRRANSDTPQLLPVLLAKTCARVLPVADASLSLFGANGIRVPVGASSDRAEVAEKLQFTVGDGPGSPLTPPAGWSSPPRR